jgi:hypothetical protein
MIRLRHIYVWGGICVALAILLIVYPINLGTKKLLLPTVGNAYVSGSVYRYIPLGLVAPTVLLSGYKDGEYISYLKFDLGAIPKSSNIVGVDVDSAELRLLASSATGNQTKFFITVTKL